MDGNTIALAGVVLAGVTTVLAILRFVTSTAEAVRTETARNLGDARKESADALKEAMRQEAHARGNALQPVSAWLQRVETDVTELQREAVRRPDLSAFDTRLTRMEGKMDGVGDKLDAFKDAVLGRLSARA